MTTKIGRNVLRRSSTLQRLSNIKTVGLLGGITLLVNGMTGTGIPFIAPLFQQAGWIIPLLLFIFFAILATFCSLFIVEAMQAIPGNRYFQGTVEFGTLINFYFGQTEHIIGQICLYGALESSAIQAIILSAQTMDNILIDIFHQTCGVSFGPIGGWYCVSDLANGSPFGNQWMFFTGGIILVIALCVPMGMVDLDSNVWLQIVSFAITLLVFLQWLVAGALAGVNTVTVPIVGSGFESVVGVVMLNFAFTTIVPSWVNIKMKDVNTQATLWYSCGTAFVLYMMVGIIPAMAFNIPVGSNLIPALDVQGVPQTLSKAATYIFSIVALITSIPVFFIVARDNLVQNRILGRRAANFVAFVVPWIVAIPFQAGNVLSYFVNWSSLIFTSIANFIIPLIIYLRCLNFRRAYNEDRALTLHQKQLLKAIHYASNTIKRGIDEGSIDSDCKIPQATSHDSSLPFQFVVVDDTVPEEVSGTNPPQPILKTTKEPSASPETTDSDATTISSSVISIRSPSTSFTELRLSMGESQVASNRNESVTIARQSISPKPPVFSLQGVGPGDGKSNNSFGATPSRDRSTIMRGLQTIMRPPASQRDEPFLLAQENKSGDEVLDRILRDDVPDPDADYAMRDKPQRGISGRLLSSFVAQKSSSSTLQKPAQTNSTETLGSGTGSPLPFYKSSLVQSNISLKDLPPGADLPFATDVPKVQPIPKNQEEHSMRSSRTMSFRSTSRISRAEILELSNFDDNYQNTESLITSDKNNSNMNSNFDESEFPATTLLHHQVSRTSASPSGRKIQFAPSATYTLSPTKETFAELKSRKITQFTEPSFVSHTTFRAIPKWIPIRGVYVASGFLAITTIVTAANLIFNILQVANVAGVGSN